MGASCSSDDSFRSKKHIINKFGRQSPESSSHYSGSTILANSSNQKHWISYQNSFLSTEKFFASFKGCLLDQNLASEVWSKANVKTDKITTLHNRLQSQSSILNLKHLIRVGVPLDKVSYVILQIFNKAESNNDLEYQCALKVAFPVKIPCEFKNVPLLSFSQKLEEVLPVHFLNAAGLDAFKRIMWVYEKNMPFLNYSPLLSQVVAHLLLFLKEHEVYCIVKEMLDRSERLLKEQHQKKERKSLKWYFTLTKREFEASLESLSNFIKNQTNGVYGLWKHLEKINYNCNDLIWRLIQKLFFDFLPLSLSLRIFFAYINEGIKVYYRFTLALLQILDKDILRCNNTESVVNLIKEKTVNLTRNGVQSLIFKAYALNLQPLKQKFSVTCLHNFSLPEAQRIYFPELMYEPSILNTMHFESIWNWLPDDFKLSRPIQAFASKTHGWSLNTLYACCQERDSYRGVLIIIQTTNQAIFGALIDSTVEIRNSSIGSDESFVFKLDYEEKKYNSTKKNSIYMICEKDSLSIGAGLDGSSIYLGSGLLSGCSYKSDTYQNEPLHHTESSKDHQFECSAFELYWIV